MNENDGAESSRLSRYLEQGLTILPRPRFGPANDSLQFPFLRPSRCANPCIIKTAMIGNSHMTSAWPSMIRYARVGRVPLLHQPIAGSKPTRSHMKAKSFRH